MDKSTDLWYHCQTTSGSYQCKHASNEGLSTYMTFLVFCGIKLRRIWICFQQFSEWIQAVQALMILSCIFCFCALIAFLYQLFRMVKGGQFFFTAIFQILASEYNLITEVPHPNRKWAVRSSCHSIRAFFLGVFVMCGAIIYTVMRPDEETITHFGYAYVLAWVAFPLCLISGLIYIVLRKTEWE